MGAPTIRHSFWTWSAWRSPAYSDECWEADKACAYQDADILIAVHPDMVDGAPDVVEMLKAWDFNIEVYKEVARWLNEKQRRQQQ